MVNERPFTIYHTSLIHLILISPPSAASGSWLGRGAAWRLLLRRLCLRSTRRARVALVGRALRGTLLLALARRRLIQFVAILVRHLSSLSGARGPQS